MGMHGEKMNFFERIHNLFNHLIIELFIPGIQDPFNEIFKLRFKDRAVDVMVTIAESSLINNYAIILRK